MSEYDDLLDEVMSDELTEGAEAGVVAESRDAGERAQKPAPGDSRTPDLQATPSASIIRTPEEVPAALERVVGPTIQDRAYIDQEWLLRRAGKKKR